MSVGVIVDVTVLVGVMLGVMVTVGVMVGVTVLVGVGVGEAATDCVVKEHKFESTNFIRKLFS